MPVPALTKESLCTHGTPTPICAEVAALRSFGILVHVKILYEPRLRDNSVRCDAELVTY